MFSESLFPKRSRLNVMLFGDFGEVLYNSDNLPLVTFHAFRFRTYFVDMLSHGVNDLNFIVPLYDNLILRVVRRAAVGRLSESEIFVVAHLQIEPPRVAEFGGFRTLEHFKAVATVLYAQAYPEFCVAPYLVIHDAGWLLRGENEVYAKTAPDSGRADKLVHKFRLLLFQFGELVGDNKQVRERLGNQSLMIQLLIAVNVHSTLVCGAFRFVEKNLPPPEFALDGHQGTLDRGAVQIRNRSYEVRKMDSAVLILECPG